MLNELTDYNWEKAFECAGEITEYLDNSADVREANPGSGVSLSPFSREDVESLIGIRPGEKDEANWLVAGKLKDGRWFFLSAGCDYTGWDCRSGGYAMVATTKEELLQFGVSEEERASLLLP